MNSVAFENCIHGNTAVYTDRFENITSVPVYIHTEMFEFMEQNNKEVAMILFLEEAEVIVVSEAFMVAPEWHQHAVLLHEEGHYTLHNGIVKSKMHFVDPMVGARIEIEADAYAVSKGAQMKQALERFELTMGIDLTDRIMSLN